MLSPRQWCKLAMNGHLLSSHSYAMRKRYRATPRQHLLFPNIRKSCALIWSRSQLYNERDVKLAAEVAVRSWYDNERQLCSTIQTLNCINAEIGKKWIDYWMLARAAPLVKRDTLYPYMTLAKKKLICLDKTGEDAYKVVQALAECGKKLDVAKGLPLSIMSKLAFCCQPTKFAPYDKRARTALRNKMRHRIKDGDYIEFMAAFISEFRTFEARLALTRIDKRTLQLIRKTKMDRKLFALRAFDKWLMIIGGFSRAKMRSIAYGPKQKRHA